MLEFGQIVWIVGVVATAYALVVVFGVVRSRRVNRQGTTDQLPHASSEPGGHWVEITVEPLFESSDTDPRLIGR